MNCPNCKTPLPADAAFCPNCGVRPSAAPAAGGVRTYSGLSTVAPMRESRTSVLESGTMFAERYEVVRKIGEGGMGVVYVVRDKNTGEEIVLKLIHPDLVAGEEAVKRLMAEGLTARQIRHPNIVAVYDVSLSNGQPYFTMEFVRGGTLRSWLVSRISSGAEVRLDTAAGLIQTMLKGLAEAHRMGIVHRDLKPENVLLVGDPEAGNFDLKILDFGIARAIDAPRSSGGGAAIGTPLYMAPEQMTSAEAVGPTADIYSLSVMFYELLMEASPQARWEPISRNRPDVPKAIDDLIEKGLSARPRSRFPSADAYQRALDAAMSMPVGPPEPVPPPVPLSQPLPVPPPAPVPAPSQPSGPGFFGNMSKRTKTWGGAAVAVLVLAMFGVFQEDAPIDTDGDGVVDAADACPAIPGIPPSGCPPQGRNVENTPAPVIAAATEEWNYYDANQGRNPLHIERNGNTFSGAGEVRGVGRVTLNGSVGPSSLSAVLAGPGGTIYQGLGRFAPSPTNPGFVDAIIGPYTFHIDH